MQVLREFEVTLDTAKILRGQGVDPARASPQLVRSAAEALEEAPGLIQPAAVYDRREVRDFHHQRLEFDGGIFEGSLVARALAGASEIILAICTIGPALEEKMTEYAGAGDMIRMLALDGAGIAALREVSMAVSSIIDREAATRNLKTGMRANPGQEGWNIEQQRVLFGLLPANEIGVTLTDSCLMVPKKSVSFVIGLGAHLRADAVPCDFCSKRERCRWRQEKGAGNLPPVDGCAAEAGDH